LHVIESVPSPAAGPEAQLLLRPPRALTAGQFRGLFVGLGGAIAAVAGVNFALGNVFAPPFAVLDIAIVGAALRHVWRQGERRERLVLGERTLEVHRTPGEAPVFSAHPAWVRLRRVRDAGEVRVRLRSSGREVEVGAFLAEAERELLAQRLEIWLARARSPGRDMDN
jgi:uncharacterized membrane protein